MKGSQTIARWAIKARAVAFRFTPIVVDGNRYDRVAAGPHYMPWLHNAAFLALYAKAELIERGHYQGLSVAPRAYLILKAAESAAALPDGDFVECGVFRGGTALLAAEVIALLPPAERPTFHLFDTFGGIPCDGLSPAERLKGRAGELHSSLEETRSNLAAYDAFLRYHPGPVPETFVCFSGDRRVRYLHIDINTAAAHRACLEFFLPRLADGAIVMFDDYGWPHYGDCKRAIDDCFERELP